MEWAIKSTLEELILSDFIFILFFALDVVDFWRISIVQTNITPTQKGDLCEVHKCILHLWA